jgi:prepilin-type N-terminal cleavage/methylation domain-containing protein
VRRALKDEGFTLLEVLVALAILAMGASLTLSLVSGSLRNIRKVQLRNRAIQHAETVLELSLLDEKIKHATVLRGDFEDGTRWSVQIQEYMPPADQKGFMTPEQIQAMERMSIKLFAYTVEVVGPESSVPDFRVQTLKLVNTQDPLQPIGVPR